MGNIIEIRNLKKVYKRFSLCIDKIEIQEGTITGLIGKNGAGKTTLINCLMNIVDSTYDEYTFNQKECQICGKKFWPSNGREVLCAAECKAENRRKKQLEYYYKKQEKENAQWNDSSQTKERESTTNSSETTISHSSKPLTAHQSGDSADCAIAI